MANRAVPLLGGEREGPMASDVGTSSATPHRTAGLHMIASEERAPYKSVRAEAMVRSRRRFSSNVAHEIEHSKAHWSELSGHGDSDGNINEEEEVFRENFQVFEELRHDRRWMTLQKGSFFKLCVPTRGLGRTIAEGGQAAIFETLDNAGLVEDEFVLKVFKKGTRLSQLRQQWPFGVLQLEVLQIVHAGFIVEDGRFAFAMSKCWGDLRKLIDQAMQAKKNQHCGPPFPLQWDIFTMRARDIMEAIAEKMYVLHKKGIVHRDVKASNILLHKELNYPCVVVADFECSIGVVGTGFWRAPEILLGLKNKSVIHFSKEADVYAFGMTCFEIVTGLLPFEGELEACPASYDLVIEGCRPKLPSSLHMHLKELIEKCWDPNPLERPAFREIFIFLSTACSVV